MSIKEDLLLLRELEELADSLPEGSPDRKRVERVMLAHRRELKIRALSAEETAALLDKAALPLGAAIPGLLTVLGSAGFIPEPSKSIWMVVGSLVGALAWVILRILSLLTAIAAKRDLVSIGKVD